MIPSCEKHGLFLEGVCPKCLSDSRAKALSVLPNTEFAEMKLLKFDVPVDRVAAESALLEKLHQAIAEYVGIMTVCQVIGVLELCKLEVRERQ